MPEINPNLDVVGLAKTAGVDPVAATAERIAYPSIAEVGPINPDVAVGNLAGLKAQATPSSATTVNPPTVTNGDFVQTSDQAKQDAANAQTQAGTTDTTADDAYKKAVDLMTQRAKDLEQLQASTVSDINRQSDINLANTQEKQRMESGASGMALARMGGYLGGTGSGLAYMNSLTAKHAMAINELELARAQAVNQAKLAFSDKQFETAKALVAEAKTYQDQIAQQRKDSLAALKQAAELQQLERTNTSDTIKAVAASGITPPDGYLAALDKKMGYATGVSKGLLAVAQEENKIDRLTKQKELAKSEAEINNINSQIKTANYSRMINLQQQLQTMKTGESITIGEHTYFGTFEGKQQTWFETDETTGMGKGYVYNTTYKTWQTQDLGFVGRKSDGWETKVGTDGKLWRYNKFTDQMVPMEAGDSGKAWATAIPEGTVWNNGGKRTANIGQCGAFVNDLTGLQVGDTFQSKLDKVDSTIGQPTGGENPYEPGTAEYSLFAQGGNPVRVGDVVVANGVKSATTTGHVAIINDISVDDNGKRWFTLSESNAKGDLRVSHTRKISEDDPMIAGFARGDLDSRLFSGSDYPTFPITTSGSATVKPLADLTGLTAEQQLQAKSLSTEIFGKIQGSAAENVNVIAKLMREGKSLLEIKDSLASSSQLETMGPTVKTAALEIGKDLTAEKRANFYYTLRQAEASGNPVLVRESLKNATLMRLDVAQEKSLVGKDRTVEFLTDIQSDIDAFQKDGGTMGIFEGTEEQIMGKVGAVSQPELRSIANKIALAVFNYRNAMSGVAFSVQEAKSYEQIFPSISRGFVYNKTVIDSLNSTFRNDVDFTYRNHMTPTAFNALFGTYGATTVGMREAQKAGIYGGSAGSTAPNEIVKGGITYVKGADGLYYAK